VQTNYLSNELFIKDDDLSVGLLITLKIPWRWEGRDSGEARYCGIAFCLPRVYLPTTSHTIAHEHCLGPFQFGLQYNSIPDRKEFLDYSFFFSHYITEGGTSVLPSLTTLFARLYQRHHQRFPLLQFQCGIFSIFAAFL